MTLYLPTRRSVAVRSRSLVTTSPPPGPPLLRLALLGLGLLLVLASVAPAQGHNSIPSNSHSTTPYSSSMPQGSNSLPGSRSVPLSNSLMAGHSNNLRDHTFGSALISSIPASRSGLQLGLRGRWWDDHKTVKKLSLRSDQQQHMDTIFETNKPTLINLLFNLQREQAHLAALPTGDPQDETRVFAAIDRIAQARADLEKENIHMLLQLRNQLDPHQVAALDRQISKSKH